MGDTIPLRVSSDPDGIDLTNDRATSDHVDAAFLELVRDLELFVDEVLQKPTFHQLLDLPIELRYQIYQEYFLEDSRSLTTRTWPELDWRRINFDWTLDRRSSAPFLPSFCLVSKFLLKEIGAFLFATVTFKAHCPMALLQFLNLSMQRRFPGLDIANSIRKLKCYNINSKLRLTQLCANDPQNSCMEEDCIEMASMAISTALNSCGGLRELELHFNAPVRFLRDYMPPSSPRIIAALNISSCLDGCFNVNSVLALRDLRRLVIGGNSGQRSIEGYTFNFNMVIFEQDTVDQLRPLSRLAEKIKAGFTAKGQDVEVVTKLYWAKMGKR
ncbi:hypothetical protein EKO04_004788 [Ascochyta lentis]|uniref:Uncharacterized protein n=1 Tax=Ascochyta lentis TaxID=205686 RepID=A0A8H7MKL2_9PLEO|nr:hypothetical protein EKO04_004788 [Ascochyta lentis]